MELLLEKRVAGITVRMILAQERLITDLVSQAELKAAIEGGIEIRIFRSVKGGRYVAQTKDTIVDQSYVLTGCIDDTLEDVDRCSGSCHRRNEECIIEAATACWEAMWDAADKYTKQDVEEMTNLAEKATQRRAHGSAQATLRDGAK